MTRITQAKSLKELIALSGPDIDPLEAALLIAREDREDFDLLRCQQQLDDLAARALEAIDLSKDALHCAQSLCFMLGDFEGFEGDSEDYFNPDNSYIDAVLESKTGIPISLALVYLNAASRLDLEIHGVGFPGHFLVALEHRGQRVIIDPFENQVITREECMEKLAPATVSDQDLEQLLQPIPNIDFVVRMVTNLLQNYVNLEEFELALRCQERIALLAPDSPTRHMELARIYRHMGRSEAAIKALEPLFNHPDKNLREFIEGAVTMLENDDDQSTLH